jgi:hypothetical protein
LAVGCNGSDSSEDAASQPPTTDTDTDTGSETGADTGSDDDPEVDLPMFASDFDRVCTTQVGFAGATPLTEGSGPHPIVLFQETDSGLLIESAAELPAGWAVDEDSNFDDNADLVPTELIGCSQIVAQEPNGVSCDLEGDDGTVTTLDLVDVTYELTVHEATTGALVGTETIEAADTECPFVVFIEEGDTQYFNSPEADQYTDALQSYVAPA